ncbi:MAG: peptide chain release factor N(5)-glutamine methyltransferase [Cyclobacteriaceae bacterium]|nr:peptide chain release factor N(5)-glutamine methyltransferase [Cyclobacteriaceae bacterium SS2]
MLSNAKTIFRELSDQLASVYGPDEAKNIAYLILEEVTALDKTDILIEKPYQLSGEPKEKISNIIERLLMHEPIQYILGKAAFYGFKLSVNEYVLIPRQETEELVDWIIKSDHQVNNMLDIGTGSGCIPIALAKHYPSRRVHAWDVSAGALAVAKENAAANEVNIRFHLVDVLDQVPDEEFDLIVSNPPYVLEEEKAEMQPNVLDHEPGTALFVPNQDPLLFYRTICELSMSHLHSKGWLYFEINERYGQKVIDLMNDHQFTNIEIRQDLNGKDRMVRGQKS